MNRPNDDDQQPIRSAIVLRRLSGSQPLRYYTYIPDSFGPGQRIVALVHGISRNAREHILAFAPWAQKSGLALVAPLFDRENCRDFQQLGWTGAGWRVDRLLRRAIDDLATDTDADARTFAIFGYSGGAQFAHRYALAHPDEITCLATCAAGYYTWPTAQLPFPYGLDCQALPGSPGFQLDDFLAIPTLTTVGLRDTVRDASLRTNPELDALQGRTRIERAKRWVDALMTATLARGLEPRHQYAGIERVGHDFRKAFRRGLADCVWPFLTAAPSSPINSASPRTNAHEKPIISG